MTTTVLERVKMENQYAKLFEAMKIGKMTLKNRLVMAPMGTFTPMQDGTESEEGIAYYEERARGGIGMIIIGAQFLNEKQHRADQRWPLTIIVRFLKLPFYVKEFTDGVRKSVLKSAREQAVTACRILGNVYRSLHPKTLLFTTQK